MPETMVYKSGFSCCRCSHQWVARKPRVKRGRRKGLVAGDPSKPRLCPKCKTPFWDVPKAY